MPEWVATDKFTPPRGSKWARKGVYFYTPWGFQVCMRGGVFLHPCGVFYVDIKGRIFTPSGVFNVHMSGCIRISLSYEIAKARNWTRNFQRTRKSPLLLGRSSKYWELSLQKQILSSPYQLPCLILTSYFVLRVYEAKLSTNVSS